ncbi:hypothetical protein UK23_42335 [Lentzea aerocolonigenes]|uniref:Uncharacterized protein n=1 Tax=Lentzea aerocolonigenes TaxID=68170 RepID=A0A0F0GDL2_LENAE|nr:hypothetical protein [Lentzea aerocolonigenes]KJK36222.1 hypothetical protein UK23_42335 [Lentzea aerocolonigenes]
MTALGELADLAEGPLLPGADDAMYLLECVLVFEGVAYWADDLAWAVAGEEYCLPCPGCAAELVVYDKACTDETGGSRPLVHADPRRLTGIGRRLHDTAIGHGRQHVAEGILRLFGQATCPLCATEFSVAGRVL